MKIGLCGKMCAGKSFVANRLAEEYQAKIFSFAGKVKEIARDLFNMKEKDRKLLQDIGKKMRDIDKNVWIDYVLRKTENINNVIVDDIRYPNELKALRDDGFIIFKLTIPEEDRIERIKQTYPNDFQEHLERLNHESEMHITKLDADYTILSNSNTIDTIKNLLKMV
jgi:dephospho-CoA kinase